MPKQISTPENAIKIAKTLLQDKYKEHCIGLYLNTRNKITKAEIISIGTLDANMVHPREVFRSAIVSHSAGIILLHNHPSGDANPSSADNAITEQLEKAGKILGIELLDHIIFTDKDFYSYNKNNLI